MGLFSHRTAAVAATATATQASGARNYGTLPLPATAAAPSGRKSLWHRRETAPVVPTLPPTVASGSLSRRAAKAVTLETPPFAVAAHAAVDAAEAQSFRQQRGKLDDLLEVGARAENPKQVLRRYLRRRCAVVTGHGAYLGTNKLRDAVFERGGRTSVNVLARGAGRGAAFVGGYPAQLMGAERGAQAATAAGNAVARALAWPLQALLELGSLGVTVVAVLVATLVGSVGFVGGWAAAAVVLAITPSLACSAWLRGRSLERSARRHADDATAWLKQTFGTRDTEPRPKAKALATPEASARGSSQVTARVPVDPLAFAPLAVMEWNYAKELRELACASGLAATASPEQQLDLLQQQAAQGVDQMPWLSRQVLGWRDPAAARASLAEAHEQVQSVLSEGNRHKRSNAILLERAARSG